MKGFRDLPLYSLLILCLLLQAVPFCASASSITLASAVSLAEVQAPEINKSVTQTGPPGQTAALGKGFAQSVGTPNPTATASVTGGNFIADADLTYQFEIVGPKAVLPVFISGVVTAGASPGPEGTYFLAGAMFIFKDVIQNVTVLRESTCASNGDCSAWCPTTASCSGVSFSGEFELLTNWIYSIQIHATAQACAQVTLCQGLSTSSVYAFADPSIYIDPFYVGVNQYTIALSEGVGNPPPAPEPASVFLAVSGLAALFLRKRRSKSSTAAFQLVQVPEVPSVRSARRSRPSRRLPFRRPL